MVLSSTKIVIPGNGYVNSETVYIYKNVWQNVEMTEHL